MSRKPLSLRLLRRILSTLLTLVENAMGIPSDVRKLRLSDLFTIPSGKTVKNAAFEDYFPHAVSANDFLFDVKKPPTKIVTVELPDDAYKTAFTGLEEGFIFREKHKLVTHLRDNERINFVFKNNPEGRIVMSNSFLIGFLDDWIDKFYDIRGKVPYVTFNGQTVSSGMLDRNVREMTKEAFNASLVNLRRRKLRGQLLEQ